MKKTFAVITMILAFIGTVFAEKTFTEDTVPNEYFVWVKTDDGSSLNMRRNPKYGSVVGKLHDDYSVKVLMQTKEKDTIDGISEWWYYVRSVLCRKNR